MENKEYDLIFSLGGSCAAACQLVQRGLRFCSLPLDWTFFRHNGEPLRKLAESFDTDFKDFLLKENLKELEGDERGADHDGKMQYIDTYTGYRWVNHFEKPIEEEGAYELVKEKIDRRINRLDSFLSKSRRVLALVTNASLITKEDFDVLTKSFIKKYPQLNIEYVYVHYECSEYLTKKDGNVTTIEVPNAENFYDFSRTNYYWRFLDEIKLTGKLSNNSNTKILISYFSDYGEAMYDAITDILLKNGNEIFRFNINNPKVSITQWGGISKIVDESLLEQIKNFAPTVILNFNNSLPVNCFDLLPADCKICAIDADAPEVAFWNKENLEKYYEKYVFLGLQSYSREMYERFLNKKLENNYLYFPPATVVKSESLEKDKNISFIGSNFYPLSIPCDELFYSDMAIELYKEFRNNYFYSYENAKSKYNISEKLFVDIRAYYCGQERLKYMQQLEDLGLTFYGVRWWNHIAYYDFELAKCFDSTPKVTIEENQWVYNTSKISVNISHPLAKSSFSWRVMDIMASSSCLLTEDKPDWKDLFGIYLSKEVLDTVIYKDRFDMREKAIRLLNDETLRLKCVKELNNAIEQNGRWESRFKMLEDFLSIPFLNTSEARKDFIFIKREVGVASCENEAVKEIAHKEKFVRKARKLFSFYEKFANKIKNNQFANIILLLIVSIAVFYVTQISLFDSKIISNETIIKSAFCISVCGLLALLIAYLCSPLRFVLKFIKKIVKKIVDKLK